MLLGVITDTHDNKDKTRKAIAEFNRRDVDLVVHAGDMIAPFTALLFDDLKAPYRFHTGNNDGEILMLKQKVEETGGEFNRYDFEFEFGNRRFLVQHEPVNLDALAASGMYDCIIYGHTHDADNRTFENGTLVLNPGECCTWLRGLANIAIIETDTMGVEIIDLL
jgi:putative phosphoesterase